MDVLGNVVKVIWLEEEIMPARDIYHDQVVHALIADGWKITHDPLRLELGSKDMYVDIGAEKLLAAQKDQQKIAVEIKSFIGKSEVQDLRDAVGQYVFYEGVMNEVEPDRILYLAVPQSVFNDLFEEPIGQVTIKHAKLRIVIFDEKSEVIIRWIT
jgi:hypothetical protein